VVLALLVVASAVLSVASDAARGGGAAGSAAGPGQAKPEWWPGEGPAARNTVVGKVTAVSPTSITLATKRGPQTFAVTEATKVMVRGQKATINDVKVDDSAVVRFAVASDGTRWAKGILVPKPRFAGRISGLSENGFTLAGKEHTWNVTLAPNARILSRGYVGTFADLRAGYWAAVEGQADGDNITASTVWFRPEVIKGVIEQVNGNELSVKTIRQRVVKVTVTNATAILVRPRTAPNQKGTLADIKPGVAANIGGHVTGQDTMTALWVDLLVTGPPQGAPGAHPRRVPRR